MKDDRLYDPGIITLEFDPVALQLHDAEDTIHVWNEAICRLTGGRQGKLPIGVECHDMLDGAFVRANATRAECRIEGIASGNAGEDDVSDLRFERRGQAVDIALSIVAESDREQIARASGVLWYLEDIVVALGLYPPPS